MRATNLKKSSLKKRLVAGGVGVAVLAGGGIAYAHWSTTGSGTGTAQSAADTASLVLTQTGAPADLAPGVAAGAVTGSVSNQGPASGYVNAVTVRIAGVTRAPGATGGCDATDYVLSGAVMPVHQELAAGSSAAFSGATLGFNDKADVNQDGCKGATVQLAYSSS